MKDYAAGILFAICLFAGVSLIAGMITLRDSFIIAALCFGALYVGSAK